MESGSVQCSGAPRPLAAGFRGQLLADERVALDVRPQGLGSVATKVELEVNHLLEIDRGNICTTGS